MAKTPTDIRSLARSHTESAINVLKGIMNEKKAPAAARVSAASELLSRGWGKPTQPHSGDENAPPIQAIVRSIVDPQNTNG